MRASKPIPIQPDSDSGSPEIDRSDTPETPSSTNDDDFQPLAMCPEDARSRFERRARLAGDQSMRAAIELKCIDCCGWSRPEAARCEIRTCPLWATNRRVFKGR